MKGNLPDTVLSAAARNGALLVSGLRFFSVQDVDDLLATNDFSFTAAEDGQQANMLLLAANFVPRDPQAIRRSEVGSTELVGQMVGREDKFFLRRTLRFHAVGVVKAVDDQLPVDLDRLVLLVVEVGASGETADRRLADLSVLGLGPSDEHLDRFVRLFLPLKAKVPSRVLVFIVILGLFVGSLQRVPSRRFLGRLGLPGQRPARSDPLAT